MINWIKRRNQAQALNIWEKRTATPILDDVLFRVSGHATAAPRARRRAELAVNATKKLVDTQAFYLVVLAWFNDDCYLNREMKSFFRMLASRQSGKGR